MKLISILTVSSILIQACSAGIWSGKTDPIKAEANLPLAPTSKFDYKLSFKKNFYYNDTIPFWTIGGDVLKSTDFLRLSPSIPNTKGWVWSDIPNPYQEWEIEMGFKVAGNHINGGRGLAFWYAKEKNQEGPVFGSKDKWDGLSVWLDSANPRTHKQSTMVLLNDGTLGFSEGADPTKHMLGSCSISYRNTDNTVYLKVSYKEDTLTVSMDNGSGNKDYLVCVKKSGIKLPTGYYFGISAASHTPADDHDIISFETSQLNPPQKSVRPKRPLEEEKKKRGQEFTGIDQEQKKKIEEAEFQMRKLRESSAVDQGETAVTMAAIYDTQRRTIEQLEVVQMQIEALGAPSPSDAITGNYQKVAGSNNPIDGAELKRITEQIRTESEKNFERFEKLTQVQNRKIDDVEQSIKRVEQLLSSLDTRMLSQSNAMQRNMNEVKLNSAETKGVMSTILKYIFYAIIAQFLFGIAAYFYWKLRVERNEKKFV